MLQTFGPQVGSYFCRCAALAACRAKPVDCDHGSNTAGPTAQSGASPQRLVLFAANSMPTVRRDGCLATVAGDSMYYVGGSNGPMTGPTPATALSTSGPPSNEFILERFYYGYVRA